MLRVEVSEEGQPALPALDVDGNFVIGSRTDARVRLPASVAESVHIRIEGNHWTTSEAQGDINDGHTFTIGNYRIRVAPAPTGSKASPPQRTESLARELMRNLLGTAGAPTLEIVEGRLAGAKRSLAPPESTLVIGRGDEADWIIADDDLSRAHAEIRRDWDGVRITDRGSKNGTKVDGVRVTGEVELYDGALIELGPLKLKFRDPADVRPRPAAVPAPVVVEMKRPSAGPFYVAVAIMLLALAGVVWVLSA